jgi:hypothetical protein
LELPGNPPRCVFQCLDDPRHVRFVHLGERPAGPERRRHISQELVFNSLNNWLRSGKNSPMVSNIRYSCLNSPAGSPAVSVGNSYLLE